MWGGFMRGIFLLGVLVAAVILVGCCSSTAPGSAPASAEDTTGQAIVDALMHSTCVGNLTMGGAIYVDATDHIGSDAKWSGFAIKDNEGTGYKVFFNWKNGEEKYEYKFTYDTATKQVGSVNKEARLVLDACKSA
jgi:hypothetical protein